MCCLFGLMDPRHSLSGRQKARLLRSLSIACEARGTDATGIAYRSGGRLCIHKKPLPAHQVRFFLPDDAYTVMGHTRMTTQGSASKTYNNHPFPGTVNGHTFALAHNGVLYNDKTLRRNLRLPNTKIETDSYVSVQLIERQKALSFSSLRSMAESVEGSFTFTILDHMNGLYFVKGENPLCLNYYPRLGLYVYASTKEILNGGLAHTLLKRETAEEVPVCTEEMLYLSADGTIARDAFTLPWNWYGPWSGWFPKKGNTSATIRDPWLQELRDMAGVFGYRPEDIDEMAAHGMSTDEIEEALYGGEL